MTASNLPRRFFFKSALGTAAIVSTGMVASRNAQAVPATRFPNVPLTTQDGRRVRFYDDVVKGRVLVFNTMYTVCSNICPPNTANLVAVQEALSNRLNRDVFMVSLTLQPEVDTPQALRDFARRHNARWTFLTGSRQDMDQVRRSLGFFDPDPVVDADLSQHAGMLRIGNEALDRWSMIPALAPPRQIVRAIERFF